MSIPLRANINKKKGVVVVLGVSQHQGRARYFHSGNFGAALLSLKPAKFLIDGGFEPSEEGAYLAATSVQMRNLTSPSLNADRASLLSCMLRAPAKTTQL